MIKKIERGRKSERFSSLYLQGCYVHRVRNQDKWHGGIWLLGQASSTKFMGPSGTSARPPHSELECNHNHDTAKTYCCYRFINCINLIYRCLRSFLDTFASGHEFVQRLPRCWHACQIAYNEAFFLKALMRPLVLAS